MKKRHLTPELLDHLCHHDPAAIRSRQDLARINGIMGNKRWIIHQVQQLAKTHKELSVIELGAGGGDLLQSLSSISQCSCSGSDLAPRPDDLEESIDWHQGDFFTRSINFNPTTTSVVVCNLILHHFTDNELKQLAKMLSEADHILLVEPHRSHSAKFLAYLGFPFVNHVTRHDMIVSIEAGFRQHELPAIFTKRQVQHESITITGGLRVHLT